MESKESTQIKVGVFVFLGMLLAMGIIFFLGNEKNLFEREYPLYAVFKDISGLRPGAQVQLAGIRVGVVDQISFPTQIGEKHVRVRLQVKQDYQERIRSDSTASISTQGLLGDKMIAVSLGSNDFPVMQAGSELTTEERTSIFEAAEKGIGMMDSVDQVAKKIGHFFDAIDKSQGLLHSIIYETPEKPMGKNVRQTAEDLKLASKELRVMLEKINKGEGTVGALLSDPSLYYDLRKLFGKVERNRLLRGIIRSRLQSLDQDGTDPEKHQ